MNEKLEVAHFPTGNESMSKDIAMLTCYGCMHSSSQHPHLPSGERPCAFCIRNKVIRADVSIAKSAIHLWYDGSKPVKVPMDCYTPKDMADQILRWLEIGKVGRGEDPDGEEKASPLRGD